MRFFINGAKILQMSLKIILPKKYDSDGLATFIIQSIVNKAKGHKTIKIKLIQNHFNKYFFFKN